MIHTIALALLTSHAVAAKPSIAPAISYAARHIGQSWVHVVTVNLNSDKVKVSGVMAERRGRPENPGKMVRRAKPTVAITGTFHGNRLKLPVGDIVIDGDAASRGFLPSCLAVNWFNKATIVTPTWGRTINWNDYEYVLGGGILIMRGGVVRPNVTLNKDRHVLSPNARTAAGITKDNRLILVATRQKLTLSHLGTVLKALGARDAIALDGGGSVCLYYRGKMLVPCGRPLTNLLVAWDNDATYRQVRYFLPPVVKRQKIVR